MKSAPKAIKGSINVKILNTYFNFIRLFFTKTKAPQKNTGITDAPANLVKIAAQVHILATKRCPLNWYRSECRDNNKKYITATINALHKTSLNK
jgi:hypothetical protein